MYSSLSGRNPRKQTLINRDLIGMNDSELMYFRDVEKDPEYFEQSLPGSPSQPRIIRDIALTKTGLLVLTDDSLYMIPEIAEQ
jgi:hypothetical protein